MLNTNMLVPKELLCWNTWN